MQVLSGSDLREMWAAGARVLEAQARAIDALNVFPVPDGDTGTNMALTMQATLAEATRCRESSAGAVAQALAYGALMGARGNSGVILSQFLRGLAQGLEGKEAVDGPGLARALEVAASVAYKGVSQPVEGTILTVMREAARAAQAGGRRDVLSAMERAAAAARVSLAQTPFLLPVLRQAGVVDAGGQGFLSLLEGACYYLKGETPEAAAVSSTPALLTWDSFKDYGYCTEFLMAGKDLSQEAVQGHLRQLGESVLVVGDDSLLRVHIHAHDPGRVLSYALTLGSLSQVKVENMREQQRQFLEARRGDLPLAVVAVASGEGLAQVFASLGVAAVVPGGDTMNPSVEELLQAVDSLTQDRVFLLPNNPNIIPAAQQAAGLSRKQVAVLPTRSIPQGIAALLAVNHEASFEDNLAAMEKARARVKTGEVTTAMRSMRLGGLKVKKGEALGLVEGQPAVLARTPAQALKDLLPKMGAAEDGLVTIYYATEEDRAALDPSWLGQEGEVVWGGQPHYNYIVSME